MITVRTGETDIKILAKDEIESQWKQVQLPANLPPFNNNVLWEGLSNSKIRADIEEFSPMKGDLPSEKSVSEMVQNAENLSKRKTVSPLGNGAKKTNK